MANMIYFDCFSGCSGDMLLGSLIDAGLSLDDLQEGLSSMDLHDYRLTTERVMRSGLAAAKFNVIADEGHHKHRSLSGILKIIEDSSLPSNVKDKSKEIFSLIGQVEAGIHGIPLEKVHFHEIGAVDSIIDIVGTVLALDIMGITEIYSSPLQVGGGTVKMAHGNYPVPAPATLNIIAGKNAPVVSSSADGAPDSELLTPTGAALITSLAKFDRPEMRVEKTGYGAGGRDFKGWSNVLRVWLGKSVEERAAGLVEIETNIDDMNPQIYGYVMERLFDKGALDVWLTPIQMKKNRPAVKLSVITEMGNEEVIADLILKETSTLGVRICNISRHIASRKIIEYQSSLGKIRAKIKLSGDDIATAAPEYEDCRRIAAELGMPLQEVIGIVSAELRSMK